MKIIISVALAFFLIGCSEDTTTSSPQQDIFKQVTKVTEPAIEKTPIVEDNAPEVPEIAVETLDENTQIVLKETKETAEEVKEEAAVTKGGAKLYKVCSSCHGVNGEKKALNKSQVIQGWSEVQTSTALNGYKDGSYGGAMKGLMKSQVLKLSDEDISVLAKHILEL